MKCRSQIQRLSAALARRLSALAAALLLGAVVGSGVAAQSPTSTSPTVPTSYSWTTFHAGGALPSTVTNGPLVPPNPLAHRLQGTPTGVNGTSVTEIPSFLLGNYIPSESLSVDSTGAAAFSNHFLDDENIPGSILSWAAPFDYLSPVSSSTGELLNGSITADDNDTSAQTYGANKGIATGWTVMTTFTGGWATNIDNATAAEDPFASGTVTYARTLAVADPGTPSDAHVDYQFTAPAGGGGSYSVVFHLPQLANGELRLTDAHYHVTLDHNGTKSVLYDGRLSQTEFNDPQFVAGPFAIAATDTVTVTLDNSNDANRQSVPAPNSNVYVVTDSVSLVEGSASGTGAVLKGSPTAINVQDFPEIGDALYYGFAITRDVNGIASQTSDLTSPFGNPTIGTPNPDATHRIRQLVYFGRSENIVLTDNQGNLVDNNSNLVSSPVNKQVGAVYCVDGETGKVVWRFQTPDVLNSSARGYVASGMNGDVHSTAPIGTQPFQIGPSAYETKGGATLAEGETGAAARTYAYGRFGAYTAYSPVPILQIAPADIGKYGFSLYATGITPNYQGNPLLVQYTGKFRIAAPEFGTGYTIDDDQYLVGGTFTIVATFTDATHANLVGTFHATSGTRQPAGYPAPVNLAAASDATFTAQMQADSSGNQSLTNGILQSVSASGGTANSAAVFSTPSIARMNVVVSPPSETPARMATKLCVVVADDNGLVYCLDAIGNRNGTSNLGASNDGTGTTSPVNPTYNQPIYNPGAVLNAGSAQDTSPHAHVGNTNAFWIYRPDQGKSKITLPVNTSPYNTQLPVPQAFGMASPTIYVDPDVATAATLAPNNTGSTAPLTSNATVYIGNSNGTLYSLDGMGVSPASETFNGSLQAGIISQGYFFTDDNTNTAQPNWWMPINGLLTNKASATDNIGITSAPAIYQAPGASKYTVYFTSANDDINMGRLYAVSSKGPTGAVPGAADYNKNAVPLFQFPDKKHNSLGSITGSPVVFTNPNDSITRIYFAANVGVEYPGAKLLTSDFGGRIWAVPVEIDGMMSASSKVWAYPDTYDPNDISPTPTKTLNGQTLSSAQLPRPIGSFLNATPAIGIVQYPASITFGPTGGTTYTHADAKRGDVKGQSVPMLYIGSNTEANDAQGSNFYALDLDGTTDNERNTYFFDGVTNKTGENFGGAGYKCSPLLIVNSSTKPGDGNGGAVFITSNNLLYEIGATYNSDSGTGSDRPQLQFFQYSGFGPLSSPAVAAYDTSDLQVASTVQFVTDWVYGGDQFTGFARGITPADRTGTGGDINYGTGGPGVDYGGGGQVAQNLPLHIYIFDGTANHPGMTTNMGDGDKTPPGANPIGGALPVFEWGGKVYLRISNVVPPNPNPQDSTYWMSDGNSDLSALNIGDVIYTSGSAINIQLSDVGRDGRPLPASGADIAQVPARVLPPPNPLTPTGTSTVIPEGFTRENPTGSGAQDTNGEQLMDYLPGGTPMRSMWIGAATYSIDDGTARKNTPGSRRRVISASQTAQAYKITGFDGTTNLPLIRFVQTVTLNAGTNSAATTVNSPRQGRRRRRIRLAREDQPTFGVLNPLAVRGGGYPIPLGTSASHAITIGNTSATQPDGVLGPFAGIHDASSYTLADLEAFSNGNDIYSTIADIPKNGVLEGNAGSTTNVTIVTATGDIQHGSTGDNGDPTKSGTVAPISSQANLQGVVLPGSGTAFGPYALNIADRSILGLKGMRLRNVTVDNSEPVKWHDNTGSNGPGARVNPLPWDDNPSVPTIGPNTSSDYPDMPASAVKTNLILQDGSTVPMSDTSVSPDPATNAASTPDADRTIETDAVQVQVRVPRYQPANLQIWDQGASTPSGSTPDKLTSSSTAFPQGYVATKRIYIDSGPGHNHRWDPGEAYRMVKVYTGVPVDMTTVIVNQTTDLGKLPHSFGVQTDKYSGLDPLYKATGALGFGFIPYNPSYYAYFKPVTVLNQGNVNLLNVQFDQRQATFDTSGGLANADPLALASDALDPLSFVPGYDTRYVTGPRPTLPSSGTGPQAQPFLIRTSLDNDLVAAYGRNPGLQPAAAYPGATFHKARVGEASPTLLTVPDVRRGAGGASPQPPVLDTNTYVPAYAALPYVGLAVPLGTPVGSYSQDLQVFEGIDPGITAGTYEDLYAKGQAGGGYLYKSLLTPKYGGVEVNGTNTPGAPAAALAKVLVTNNGSTQLVYAQPTSTATRLRGSVIESRVTDGATYGNLPQVDKVTTSASAADFQPAAYRDAYWAGGGALAGSGNVSLYWTAARGNTAVATTPPYNILGATLPYTTVKSGGASIGYFDHAKAIGGDSDPDHWWKLPAVGGFLFPNAIATAGTSNGISIAHDQHLFTGADFSSDGSAYAFVQNVQSGGAYSNTLYCFPVTTNTGVITGNGVAVNTDTRQPHFGVRGLKFSNVTFTDPLDTNLTFKNNLWAFWNSGTHGRSAMFYSSADTSNALSFGPTSALPLPAGLSSAADPSAIIVYAPVPDSSGKVVSAPLLEVTYTGVGADGNADIYVSRYSPYELRSQDGKTPQTDANGKPIIALALAGGAPVTEQLQPDATHQYFQARDVAWARNAGLDIRANGIAVLQGASMKSTFDPASGTLVYTGLGGFVLTDGNGNKISITTAYVDLARGRVRFRTSYTPSGQATPTAFDVPLASSVSLSATFQSQARRITTDSRADTEPVSFLDEAFMNNEAGINGNYMGRVQAARYWFLWRKSGAPGTSTTPTLFSKTQRLTAALLDASGKPVTIALDKNGTVITPHITVTINGTQVFSSSGGTADIDWARGRVYFPVQVAGLPTEGATASISCDYINSAGARLSGTFSPVVTWLDELRYNDPANQPAIGVSTAAAVDTSEHAVPIDVATNEGNISAFLDPFAYADVPAGAYDPLGNVSGTNNADQPHKVWLFWNSTRNGTSDIYYETIAPRFSSNP